MKEYKAIRIRKHRGGLDESLKTMFYAVTWEDVLNHIDIPSDEIICEPYGGGDSRIPDWDQTWVITGKDGYPRAFADDDIFLLGGAPQKGHAQKVAANFQRQTGVQRSKKKAIALLDKTKQPLYLYNQKQCFQERVRDQTSKL